MLSTAPLFLYHSFSILPCLVCVFGIVSTCNEWKQKVCVYGSIVVLRFFWHSFYLPYFCPHLITLSSHTYFLFKSRIKYVYMTSYQYICSYHTCCWCHALHNINWILFGFFHSLFQLFPCNCEFAAQMEGVSSLLAHFIIPSSCFCSSLCFFSLSWIIVAQYSRTRVILMYY